MVEQQGTKGQDQKPPASSAPPHGGQTITTTTTTRTEVSPPSGPTSYYSTAPYPSGNGYGRHHAGSGASWPAIVMAVVALVALALFIVWFSGQQRGNSLADLPPIPPAFGEPEHAIPGSGSGGIQDFAFHVPAETSWPEVPGAPGFYYQKLSDGTCNVNHPAEKPQPPPAGRAWLNQNCLP